MNSIQIAGRLTRDPEFNQVGDDQVPVCRFSVAVNRPFKSAASQNSVDFIEVVAWRKLAENCAAYLAKGKLVGVSGRLQVRSYADTQGVRRKAAEIIAGQVDFLSPNGNGDGGSSAPVAAQDEDDGDIPF